MLHEILLCSLTNRHICLEQFRIFFFGASHPQRQDLLGKSPEQLDELVRRSCIEASTRSTAQLAVVV